ncbi:sorting nexin-24 isoform X3 [Anser cygnoides]|uniref:sorting nexin-24 isoform X3 n=1 Tax=Anser cygnoides TaxID=8845 RepID=UPI0034D23592
MVQSALVSKQLRVQATFLSEDLFLFVYFPYPSGAGIVTDRYSHRCREPVGRGRAVRALRCVDLGLYEYAVRSVRAPLRVCAVPQPRALPLRAPPQRLHRPLNGRAPTAAQPRVTCAASRAAGRWRRRRSTAGGAGEGRRRRGRGRGHGHGGVHPLLPPRGERAGAGVHEWK